ncbi:MAG: class I SAM-dependent RNA methyltransferase [Kofleriaceae bacterium]|nr:class I SAM-dependent RNA methyltransferase [Kofleriaceae bacterium]
MRKKKRRIVLDIDSLAAGGDGVARDSEGRVTFIPRAVPGDRALVELQTEKKQFARGRVIEILKEGPHHQKPACDLFTKDLCGGCQWQHIDAETQPAAKEENVDKGLRRVIARGLVRKPLMQPCTPYGWRRRARLSYWAGGPKLLGFFPPKSQRITDIETCPQLEEKLQTALGIVRKHLLEELRQRGEVEILLAEDGRCHVVVHGTATPMGLSELAEQPEIAGVVNGKRLYGDAAVVLEGGIVSAASDFAQASAAGNAKLCEVVSEALGDLSGKSVLELYAGSGNFTRLMKGASRVVAVECNPMPEGGIEGVALEWCDGDVTEEVHALAESEQSFDIVLLDPTRSGSRDALEDIARLNPQRIVYISCDVATLSRDVEELHELGYRGVSAQPIDLMPQTSHVETVIVLEKEG